MKSIISHHQQEKSKALSSENVLNNFFEGLPFSNSLYYHQFLVIFRISPLLWAEKRDKAISLKPDFLPRKLGCSHHHLWKFFAFLYVSLSKQPMPGLIRAVGRSRGTWGNMDGLSVVQPRVELMRQGREGGRGTKERSGSEVKCVWRMQLVGEGKQGQRVPVVSSIYQWCWNQNNL